MAGLLRCNFFAYIWNDYSKLNQPCMPKEKLFDEDTVLERAMELFWSKGYNGTSMDELTRATGLSRSSIYNSFGDKHALFMRSIRFYQAQQQRALLEAVEKDEGSPLKKIRLAFRYMEEVILADKLRKGCLVVNSTTELSNLDEEVSALVLDNLEGMEGLFLQWVEEGQKRGEIAGSFSARALARHLFNSYNGMRVIGQAKPDRKSLDDIVAVALSVL
jgi:TetR/AcrR family transcriptional repressor of nem operon